jgi:hypothetical protein
MIWSFNRLRDQLKITCQDLTWEGPFSWPKFESINKLPKIPNSEGIYLFTFEYKDGYVISGVGITNSTKTRISAHNRKFRKGDYTILNPEAAKKGEREEIWHGWNYAKTHKEEFIDNKTRILQALENQLGEMRIFIAKQKDKRLRERIEAAIMHNIYVSKEPWSEIADRGMFLKERYNSEMPINTVNIHSKTIYGLPEELEI